MSVQSPPDPPKRRHTIWNMTRIEVKKEPTL